MTFTKQEADAIVAKGDTAQLELLKSAEVVDADGNKLSYNVIEKAAPAAVVDTKAISEMVAAEVAKAQKAVTPAAKPASIEAPAILSRKSRFAGYELKSFRGEVEGKAAEERAYDFGKWFYAANGNKSARDYCEKNGIEVKTHVEGNNDRGGYLVPDQFEADLIRLRLRYGVARRYARVRPMNSDTLSVPRQTGDVTAAWGAEAAAGTNSTITGDRVMLVAKKLRASVVASNELVEDSVISIADQVAESMTRQFARSEDEALFNGDGTSTFGGIVGIRTRLSTINGVDDGGGLVLASGNAYNEITLADFQNVIARLPDYAETTAQWIVHRSFFYSVMQRVLLAAGGTTPADIVGGNTGTSFLGYPVLFSNVMPSTAANSQICALLGDGSLSTSIGDRRAATITVAYEGTLGGVNLLDTDQVGIRAIQRLDINNHDVGSSTEAGPVVGLITAAS